MKKTLIPLLVASTAWLVGCEQPANTSSANNAATAAPVVNKADAVAVVNGRYIAKSTFDNLQKEIAERAPGQVIPKEKLLEELIQRELLIQDAEQKQLDKTPDVLAHLDEARKAILTQADVQNFMKTNPVTDAEIKAEYDSKVGGANATEYKARHILVKTEDEAKKIIAELDKGGDFAKLANKNSLDGKEAQNGGDLGWFAANQMVEPFSKAVIALEKDKYTKTPVQTQFGWHIILREDARQQTPPPLEAVKEQIMPMLQRKKVQDMLENIRKQAKVEVLVTLKEDAPKAVDAPKPATEEVVIEEEIKDKDGKTVAKETIVEEVDAPAEQPKVEAAKSEVGKKADEPKAEKKEAAKK